MFWKGQFVVSYKCLQDVQSKYKTYLGKLYFQKSSRWTILKKLFSIVLEIQIIDRYSIMITTSLLQITIKKMDVGFFWINLFYKISKDVLYVDFYIAPLPSPPKKTKQKQKTRSIYSFFMIEVVFNFLLTGIMTLIIHGCET